MTTDSLEVEVKIEYFETFEEDPFSENAELNLFGCDDNLKNEILPDSPQPLEDAPTSSTPDLAQSSGGGNTDINDDEDFNEESSKLAPEKKVTWYKEIDSAGRFLCKFCDRRYMTVQTVRIHVRRKHPEESIKLKRDTVKCRRNSKLKCHICKTKFKLFVDLQEHIKIKHEMLDIESSCTHCNATFKNSKSMLEHLYLKHNITKKQIFSCTICGYRTFRIGHFKQHNNTHLKTKQMKCEYCDYSTNYMPNLKSHRRIHTNDKPYVCDYKGCEYRCSARSALKSHQLKHNKEANMLYCDKCSYKTVYKQSLKKHADSHRRNSLRVKL